jgi:hypothetical protein
VSFFLFILIDMKFLIGPVQGFFSFLKRSSYLNFKKVSIFQYIRFGTADPGIVTVQRIFREF